MSDSVKANLLSVGIGFILGGLVLNFYNSKENLTLKKKISDIELSYSKQVAQTRLDNFLLLKNANARSDALQNKLITIENNLQKTEKEKQDAIKKTTTGSTCFNAATVRLLNANAASGKNRVPEANSKPVAEDGPVATDTDVASWANLAKTKYETCRARLNTLIDWHSDEPIKAEPIAEAQQ